MSKKLLKGVERFIEYIKRTYKNKLYALALIGIGVLSVLVLNEGTFFVAMLMMGLPLFFTKEDVFEQRD